MVFHPSFVLSNATLPTLFSQLFNFLWWYSDFVSSLNVPCTFLLWDLCSCCFVFLEYLPSILYVVCLVAKTLCDPMDYSPPDSSVRGDSPGKNTGVGGRTLLQGIFPTQGSNPGLRHCRWIRYHLSHQGSSQYSTKTELIYSSLIDRLPLDSTSLNAPWVTRSGPDAPSKGSHKT